MCGAETALASVWIRKTVESEGGYYFVARSAPFSLKYIHGHTHSHTHTRTLEDACTLTHVTCDHTCTYTHAHTCVCTLSLSRTAPPPPFLLCRFERGGHLKGGIQSHPTLGGKMFSLSEACGWLELLQASLDCYNWVLEDQLLSPSELFPCEFQRQLKKF